MYLAAFVITFMISSPPPPEVVVVKIHDLAAYGLEILPRKGKLRPLSRRNVISDDEVWFYKNRLGAVLHMAIVLGKTSPGTKLYVTSHEVNHSALYPAICLPYQRPLSQAKQALDNYTQHLFTALNAYPAHWSLEPMDEKSCLEVSPSPEQSPFFLQLADQFLSRNTHWLFPPSTS
jgi:hypothetical protein